MQYLYGGPFGGQILAGTLKYQRRGCGGVCIFAKYSNEAVKLDKIGQPARGCSIGHGGEKDSLKSCWKTRLRSRVDCKLVRAVDD